MADTSLIIGDGNWAVKEDSLLGYNIIQGKYVPIEMNVSRATTATRVNSAGLIELVPRNLLTYSQQFDNGAWTKIGSTITANATIAPDGTTTADKLIEDTSNGFHSAVRIGGIASAGTYTLSVFAKAAERTNIAIGNSTSSHFAIFNLSLGTIVQGSQGTVTNGAISSVDANGYYRISCNITVAALTSITINIVSTGTTTSYTGNGTSGLFIWGAQLEAGSTATEYFPTTDRFDIPRVDYSTGTASLLVEPLRTNLALYSEQFDNASWNVASTSTVTLNAGISPSGNNTANLITATALDGRRIQSVSLSAGTYTYSYFVKKGNQSSIQVLAFNSTLSLVAATADFNLDNGTLTSGTGIIQQFANGWYKVSVTFTILTTNTIFLYIKSGLSNNAIGSTVYAWGAQCELGSNATSYIPTVAATVTRNADAISKTGISNLIGQTEGTMFTEVNVSTWTNSSRIFSISDGTSTNRIMILFNTSNRFRVVMDNLGGAAQADISSSSLSNGIHKIAVGYKANDFVFYVDGVLVGSDTSATIPACSAVFLGKIETSALTLFLDNQIESATLFPTRLTNAQLATLTTL